MPQETITIESLGARGDGIGRLPDGRRIFVPGVLPGETVYVVPGAAREDGVAGKLVSVTVASPLRADPPCAHYAVCGGCVLQHVQDTAYRDFKMDQVRKALHRAGVDAPGMQGPFVSQPGTRRRVTLAAYRGDGGRLVVGFNESRSNKIVDLAECPVMVPVLMAVLPRLRRALRDVLQPRQGMDIAMMESGGAVDMVLRPWVKRERGKGRRKNRDDNRLPLPLLETLGAFAEDADIARLSWQNEAGNDADITPIVWRRAFTVDFSGTAVTPPPGGFLQATLQGEAALVSAVMDAMVDKVPGKVHVADLYAGCGTFTFALARAGYHVHAVEGFEPAVAALKQAAAGQRVSTEMRDLARDPLGARELERFGAVVIDPPRIGAKEQVEMIARSQLGRVVYVSCNPVTFARDGAILQEAGFNLRSLSVVDQFLWSPHIELAGVFVRE